MKSFEHRLHVGLSSQRNPAEVTKPLIVLIYQGFLKLAERGGFEPPIPFKGYTGLANQRLQPLGHLSTRH